MIPYKNSKKLQLSLGQDNIFKFGFADAQSKMIEIYDPVMKLFMWDEKNNEEISIWEEPLEQLEGIKDPLYYFLAEDLAEGYYRVEVWGKREPENAAKKLKTVHYECLENLENYILMSATSKQIANDALAWIENIYDNGSSGLPNFATRQKAHWSLETMCQVLKMSTAKFNTFNYPTTTYKYSSIPQNLYDVFYPLTVYFLCVYNSTQYTEPVPINGSLDAPTINRESYKRAWMETAQPFLDTAKDAMETAKGDMLAAPGGQGSTTVGVSGGLWGIANYTLPTSFVNMFTDFPVFFVH